MSLKKVINCLKRNKSFLITAHTNPEGDALGSELGFYYLLKALGKKAAVVNDDVLPYGYEFMPGVERIKKFNHHLRGIRFDCFVILDCSDLSRCGRVASFISGEKTILNIDHHVSNQRFGQTNWVDIKVSSCAEMIYKIYKALGIHFNKDIATLLYVGILTDTGSFHYTNTRWQTHRVVAELLKYNVDISRIYQNIYENIPFTDMKLLSQIVPTVKRDASGKIAWFVIPNRLLKGRKVYFDLSEKLLSFARAIKDVEVAVIFRENLKTKNEIRVNFRSQGKVNVNKIAGFFGGGGHRTASGATAKGNLETVTRRVLRKIRESLGTP